MKHAAVLTITVMIALLCIAPVHAAPSKTSCKWSTYDQFNKPELNLAKWVETPDWENRPLLDQHGVDRQGKNYHTAQSTVSDAAITLNLVRTFQPEQQLSYDLIYQSGEGNRLSRLFINGIPLDIRMRDIDNHQCLNGAATCGDIGYWNGESDWGNTPGRYHINIVWHTDTATITLTDPTGTQSTYITTQLTPPHTFAVSSRTGHNGLLHMDYDNFRICT